MDWVLAASETYHAYPSLAARLHARLGLRENCSALDVGSGCVALVQALAVAQTILVAGRAALVLVVTSDVHSRTLGPGRAKGEFGGLFGDGASAFLLTTLVPLPDAWLYRLGEFFFGCAAKYSEAIRVSEAGDGSLDVQFDGEALSRAAVNRMEKILCRSGTAQRHFSRRCRCLCHPSAQSATHHPARQTVVRLAGFVSTDRCHTRQSRFFHLRRRPPRRTGIGRRSTARTAQASLSGLIGPGLLFGGGWMVPETA